MALLTFNANSIQKELVISENAVNQAMNECPKTTDTELDIFQQNIVDHFADSISEAHRSALEKLNELDLNRSSIETAIDGFSLSEIIDSAKRKMIHIYAQWHEILDNARQEEDAIRRSFKYFVYINKLNRKASYPDSLVFHWAFVILAVLLESVVNSFFFATGSDLGLLGGLFQALFISLSNIGSALLIGIYVLPYKNHVDSKKQFRAKVFTAIYIFLAFVFNLATAHYRMLLESDPLNAKANAISHLIQDPFGINYESWNLLIIGMMFMIVALIKGYKSDDVYPGYGEIHRKFKAASDYHGKRLEALNAINLVIDECIKEADVVRRDVRRKIHTFKNSISQSEEVVLKFSKFLESAESLCNKSLWEYRDANVRVRSSKPPAYFSQKHSYNNYSIQVDLTEEKATCSKIENRLQEIESRERQKLHEGLREVNEQAIEEITGLFEKIKNDENKDDKKVAKNNKRGS